MEARGEIFIEGIDSVIKLDLGKHEALLSKCKHELATFTEARNHEIKKKRYYYRQIGKGKFNDEALMKSVDSIRVNIKHFEDKVKTCQEKVEHHSLIVDTLSAQLKEYNEKYASINR